MRLTSSSITLAAALAALAACGKDSSSTTPAADTAGNAPKVGDIALNGNPLAESYPQGLAVSAFSTTDDNSTATAAAGNAKAGTLAIDYTEATLRLIVPPVGSGSGAGSFGSGSGAPAASGSGAGSFGSGSGAPAASGSGADQCFASYEDKLASVEATKPVRPAPPPPPGPGIEAAQERISGKAASCLSDTFVATLATMRQAIQESAQPLDGYGDCFLPDWGIVNGFDPESSDVCTVAYARGQLSKLSAYVDFTKGLAEAMLCQALKDGVVKSADKEVAEGASLDLTASLVKALAPAGADAPKLTSATVKRIAGGRHFLTEFVVSPRVPIAGQGDQELAINIAVDHQPIDATNAAYSGTVRLSLPTRRRTNVAGGDSEVVGVSALSLDYSRAADTIGNRVKYELRSGFFAGTTPPYDAKGQLDYNVFGKVAENDKLNMLNYVSYDGYPEIDVAKLSYWVNFGGRYNEAARGMVFDVKRVDGKVKGCAVAGAASVDPDGRSIRRSLAEGYALQPVGYLRPFLCDDSKGAKMWLQCFVRNDAGVFVPDADLITDTKAGFDFVASSVVESKVPSLADVPRPPKYTPAQFQPPPGAPVRPANTRPAAGTPTQPALPAPKP